MKAWRLATLLSALLMSNMAVLLVAAEPDAPAQPASPATVSPEAIAGLVKDLDADQFATRELATKELVKAGVPAIAALTKAAQEGSLEAAMRAVRALGELHKSETVATKSAAEAALKVIAASKNTAVAAHVAALLDETKEEAPQQPNNGVQGIQIFGGGGGGAVFQVQIGNAVVGGANAKRNINVVEGDRKVSISQDAKGISISLTEKVEGKEKVTKYEAKDAEELKKKHPEGFKLFEKYMGNKGQVGVAVPMQGRIVLQAQPAIAIAAKEVANPGVEKVKKQIEESRTQLKAQIEGLQKQVAAGDLNEAAAKVAIEAIEGALKQLEEVVKSLE